MPFEYNNELYVVYSVIPHRILKVNLETGDCIDQNYENHPQTRMRIYMKTIGNGSCPQLVNINNNKFFLGMAHARSLNDDMKSNYKHTYRNFFYTFAHKPPFNILGISNILCFDDNPKAIEYGSGLIVDEKNDSVYISIGINDCYSKILVGRLSYLLNTIYPCKCGTLKDVILEDGDDGHTQYYM
jgi:hypothetical protein